MIREFEGDLARTLSGVYGLELTPGRKQMQKKKLYNPASYKKKMFICQLATL
jgi:hypothetical protein